MSEVLLIALVVLLFFGGAKIPELMKGLGKGVRSFKDGMNGVDVDAEKKAEKKKRQRRKLSMAEDRHGEANMTFGSILTFCALHF